MKDSNIIYFEYVGADYSCIDDALKTCKAYYYKVNSVNKTEFKEIDEELKKEVLYKAIEEINKDFAKNQNLVINKSKYRKEENDKKALIANEKQFEGYVGVIEKIFTSKDIKLTTSGDDLKKAKTKSKFSQISVKLEIVSRFDVDENNERTSPKFLATMLLGNNLKFSDNNIPADIDGLYDFLLLFWYKEYFVQASKKGLFQTYRRFENNDDRMKGSLNVARHIRLNAGQSNGKIAYSYREKTINNYLNLMIALTYDCLKKKYRDMKN